MFSETCKKWLCKDSRFFFFRLAAGVPFFLHGWMKLGSMDMTVGFFATLGLPAFVAWLVALLELVGGLSLILGYGTKWAAKLLAIDMFFAIVLLKSRAAILGGHEIETVLFLLSLGLAFAGHGGCCGADGKKDGEACSCREGACEMHGKK